jgi:hypothetical protein
MKTVMPKVALVALVAVLPGGLLILGAWVLAKIVAERMQRLDGTHSQRLLRALTGIRMTDLRDAARRI